MNTETVIPVIQKHCFIYCCAPLVVKTAPQVKNSPKHFCVPAHVWMRTCGEVGGGHVCFFLLQPNSLVKAEEARGPVCLRAAGACAVFLLPAQKWPRLCPLSSAERCTESLLPLPAPTLALLAPSLRRLAPSVLLCVALRRVGDALPSIVSGTDA